MNGIKTWKSVLLLKRCYCITIICKKYFEVDENKKKNAVISLAIGEAFFIRKKRDLRCAFGEDIYYEQKSTTESYLCGEGKPYKENIFAVGFK